VVEAETLMTFDGRKNLQISYNLLNLPQTVNQAGMQMATYYNTTDHLASIRVITDQAGTVAEQNDYYPFGKRTNTGEQYLLMPTNRYKFNGKELQTIANMEYLDYGARFYDPTIVRTPTPDPHSESYYSESPYSFLGNNPIVNIDPTGMDWYSYTDADGNVHYKYQNGSDKTIKVGDNTYSNIGASVNIQLGERYYYNAFQNYGVTSLDKPIDVKQRILDSPSLQGKLLSEGSGFSAQGQAQIMTALIHQGQEDFLNHPVTKATINGLLFVATGGIEGAVSLLSAGRSLLARGVAQTGTSLWPAASGGRTVINGLEYTTHALERMQPVGTIMKGSTSFSRGIPPSAVENAIRFGKVTPGNTATEVVRTFENVRVITNPQGTRVISVIKIGN
jgi:RHS repeat-associated protein